MLDLDRLHKVKLFTKPPGQWVLICGVTYMNYRFLPGIQIEIEGIENIPEEPVVFAMNHTDNFNYAPFMTDWIFRRGRYITNWVKGKNFDHPLPRTVLEWTNNLPLPSRGYVISKDFLRTTGRRPSEDEYRAMRDLVEGKSSDRSVLPKRLLEHPRNMLGRRFDPRNETYERCVRILFADMMRRFVDLNKESFRRGLDLLVFPEGTRSVRLSRGRIGMAQMALHLKKTIVPIGCNGSDKIYPGSNPVARGGRVVYRIGKPLRYEEVAAFHLPETFVPYDPVHEDRYRDRLQGLTDLVMDRINDQLDERHRRVDGASDGSAGTRRFV